MYGNYMKNRLMRHASPRIFISDDSMSDSSVEPDDLTDRKPVSKSIAIASKKVVDRTAAAPSIGMEKLILDSSTTSRKRKFQSQLTEELSKVARSLPQWEDNCSAIFEIDVKTFQELASVFLPEQLAKFVSLRAALHNEDEEGYRCTNEWKQFGLYLYFVSPKAYKFISNTFGLPSIKSLQRYGQSWDVDPGLCDNILAGLKLKSKSMTKEQKQCVLFADQMPLKSHLFYNLSKDELTGIPSTGNKKRDKQLGAAKGVLVVMARGLTSNWKQPLGYYFVKSLCTAESMREILCEAIDRLKDVDLNVRCVVANTSTSFQVFLKQNCITAEHPYFLYKKNRIYFMFDPCRLLEELQNNLMSYDYRWNAHTASWGDVFKFYARDSQQRVKAAPKLTPAHLQRADFRESGAWTAPQVFSSTVAAALSVHLSLGAMPLSAVGTVIFIEQMDKLFDVFNSSKVRGSKMHNLPFTGSTMQVEFLNEMFDLFKGIKAIDKIGENVTNTVACFKGWQLNIKCLLHFWNTLEEEGLPFLLTRRLNQNSLEKFFISIKRQGAKGGLSPTPIQFTRAFKKLSALQMLRQSEPEDHPADFDLIVNTISKTDPVSLREEITVSPKGTVKEIQIDVNINYVYMRLPETNTLKYVCGYLMSECLKEHSCFACKRYAAEKPVEQNFTVFYAFRKDKKKKTAVKNISGCLTVPSKNFCVFVHLLEKKFFEAFQKYSTEKGVGKKILEELKTVPFRPPCPSFPYFYLLKLFMRMRIYYTIKYYNRDLQSSAAKDAKLINISYS